VLLATARLRPYGPSVNLRGEEEDSVEAVVARCRTTVDSSAPRASTDPRLQIPHASKRPFFISSIFRVDDGIIFNFHIYAFRVANKSVLVFARSMEPRLWDTFSRSFDRSWDTPNR